MQLLGFKSGSLDQGFLTCARRFFPEGKVAT